MNITWNGSTPAVSFHEEIAAGAALLDMHCPGWEFLVDEDKLDIESQHHCLLGQLWTRTLKDFYQGSSFLHPMYSKFESAAAVFWSKDDTFRPTAYGFSLSDLISGGELDEVLESSNSSQMTVRVVSSLYTTLTAQWKAEITMRRALFQIDTDKLIQMFGGTTQSDDEDEDYQVAALV